MFSSTLVIALRTPRQAQEAATQGTPISPSVFYWVGCAVGCVVIYVFFVLHYVMRTNVLSCLRWFEIADRVRNERVDGWLSSPLVLKDSSLDSRWRGVFAHHQAQAVGKARRPFIRLSCRRAAYKPDVAAPGMCRSGARAKRKMMMPTTAATLAQGDIEVVAGRRAALGGVADRQSVRRRNEDEHPACLLYRTALGRQG